MAERANRSTVTSGGYSVSDRDKPCTSNRRKTKAIPPRSKWCEPKQARRPRAAREETGGSRAQRRTGTTEQAGSH